VNKKSIPKIKSVKMKNGGAEVRVINNSTERSKFIEEAIILQKEFEEEKPVKGYFIFLFNDEFGTACAWDSGKVVPSNSIPDWSSTELKRALIQRSI